MSIDWKAKADDLRARGYTIIPSVLEETQALDYADQIESLLHRMVPSQDWSRPGVCSSKGIVLYPSQIAHARVVREVRYENPKVLLAFSRLWQELAPELDSTCLIGSCDRINYQRQDYNGARQREWWHVDQTENPNLCTLQGYIDLAGSKHSDTATLQVMEGSHAKSQALVRFELVKRKNWYLFPPEDYPECRARNVRANPGDLVLWDSRTIHQNGANQGKHRRLVVYTCFKPYLTRGSQPTLVNHFARKRVFEDQRCTTHTPGAAVLCPLWPQTYGKEIPALVIPPDFGRAEDKGPFQDAVTIDPKPLEFLG